MTHNEAIQMRAAERYALGELAADVREAYEEHFFDCPECAVDIRAMSAFADGAREVFANEVPEVAPAAGWQPGRSTGRGWWGRVFQPLVAVPVFGALLLVIGYQNLRTIPQLEAQLVPRAQVLRSFSLATAGSRGAAGVEIAIRAWESFLLDFDITADQEQRQRYSAYRCQLQDAAGQVLQQVRVSAEQANKTVELLLPAGMMHAGSYSIVIAGETTGQGGQLREADEVTRLGFQVSLEQ
jgi:hypothetical protein